MADEITPQNTDTLLSEGVETPAEGETPLVGDGSAEGAQTDTKSDVEEKVGAPETYEDFKFAENVKPNEGALEKFKEMAKNANLPQEKAQELVDLQLEVMQDFVDGQSAAWEDLRNSWVNVTKTDKEFGGANFKENLAIAKAPLTEWATPEFTSMLNETGIGDHPEMVRFMYRLGKAMKEDKMHVGGNPKASGKSHAEILYGS